MSDELRTTVEKLRAAELDLGDRLAAAKADLATAREREAAAVLRAALDGGSGKKAGESAAVIAEKVAALTAAIGQARAQRPAAIKAVWQAEAEDLRRQAAEQLAAADVHAAKTAELLAAVEVHEGAPYVPRARWFEARIRPGVLITGETSCAIPKSEGMRMHAQGLETQAMVAENRIVPANGTVAAAARDDLIAQVRAWSAFAVSPDLNAVIDWLDKREAAVRAKVDGIPDHILLTGQRATLEYAYTLVWRDGAIVERESGIRAFYREKVRLIGHKDGRTADEIRNVA